MDIKRLMDHALARPGAYLDYPFGDEIPCIRLCNKIFAMFLHNAAGAFYLNLKCDPLLLPLLVEKYPQVTPGYHMNKKYWISLLLTSDLAEEDAIAMIDGSYLEVRRRLPKKAQEELNNA